MKMKPLHCLLFAATLLPGCPLARKITRSCRKTGNSPQTAITVKPGESGLPEQRRSHHNVFSNSKINAFDLKTQKPAPPRRSPFSEEGTTEVRCAIHPKMKVIVTVKK